MGEEKDVVLDEQIKASHRVCIERISELLNELAETTPPQVLVAALCAMAAQGTGQITANTFFGSDNPKDGEEAIEGMTNVFFNTSGHAYAAQMEFLKTEEAAA